MVAGGKPSELVRVGHGRGCLDRPGVASGGGRFGLATCGASSAAGFASAAGCASAGAGAVVSGGGRGCERRAVGRHPGPLSGVDRWFFGRSGAGSSAFATVGSRGDSGSDFADDSAVTVANGWTESCGSVVLRGDAAAVDASGLVGTVVAATAGESASPLAVGSGSSTLVGVTALSATRLVGNWSATGR